MSVNETLLYFPLQSILRCSTILIFIICAHMFLMELPKIWSEIKNWVIQEISFLIMSWNYTRLASFL